MKIKTILTAGLLAFVAVSLAAAVADVAGLRGPAPTAAPPADSTPGDRLIAYYFHTAKRCPTCRAIEALAREAAAPQVRAGAVEWRMVNFEEPAQRHFAADFDLYAASVVLVHARDGAVVRWKNLERVWELTDDPPAFTDYVRKELAAFQEARP